MYQLKLYLPFPIKVVCGKAIHVIIVCGEHIVGKGRYIDFIVGFVR